MVLSVTHKEGRSLPGKTPAHNDARPFPAETPRAGHVKVIGQVIGAASGYPDERAALRNLLVFAQRNARPRTWAQGEFKRTKEVIQAVIDLQGVQARAGVELDTMARRIRLGDATTPREIRRAFRETHDVIDELFRVRKPGDWLDAITEVPAGQIGLTAARSDDGKVSLIWRIRNWRAAFLVTLALLLHELAADVGRCLGCGRVWVRQATGRGRPAMYCDQHCAGRARQRRHRARG